MTARTKAKLGFWTVAGLLMASLPVWRLAAEPVQDQPGAKAPAVASWSPGPDPGRQLTFVTSDKPIYRGGESVYLRGLVLHHAQRAPLQGDLVGLLKIIGPKGDVITSQRVQSSGGAWGTRWTVPAEMAGGEYTARVTYPLNGMPPAERQFDIRQYRAPRLKSQIKFLRDGYGPGDEVAATLEVERAEGGFPAGAPVTVTARVDGAEVHQGRAQVGVDGRCVVRFPLPAKIERGEGTLALAIHDGGVVETAAKTIPILLQSVDITLYPEGGELVQGLASRVYFEAFTPSGKPADLAGEVVDDRGRRVALFRSEHEGRGRIELTSQPGRSYKLRFTEPAGITQQVDVPEAVEQGIVVASEQNVYDHGQPIAVVVGSATGQKAEVIVRQREKVVARKQVSLDAGRTRRVSLDLGDQPGGDGVLTVTVNDQQGRPRAERLVFRRPQHQVRIKITPQSTAGLNPGGKVRLKVETTDEDGHPVSALVGMSVTDESVLEMIDRREQAPMLPVMVLLENEVDDLADAHVYLDAQNPRAPLSVDLLLGVQGWRRWALVDPNKWLADHGDAGRRVLAHALPPMIQTRRGWALGRAAGGFPLPQAALERDADINDAFAPLGEVDAAKKDKAKANELPRAEEANNQAGDRGGQAPAAPRKPANQPVAAAGPPAADRPAPAAEPAPVIRQQGQALAKVADNALDGRLRNLRAVDGKPSALKELGADSGALHSSQLISVRIYAHQVRSGRRAGERTDFTETLFWTAALKTNDKGVAEVEFGLSDAVTTFQVRADAVDGRGGLGAAQAKIESVEPFYLEPKLPLEVTMGDRIQIPLGVVNATAEPLDDVRIEVATEGFQHNAKIPSFKLAPGQRTRKPVEILVGDFVGEAELEVTSTAGDYRDQVTRRVQVAPAGFPYEDGGGSLLLPDGVVEMEIDIPAAMVPGSVSADALVFPTPLATMTAALERLIREPSGCFEQTSSTTYPLVMAQQYFKSHEGVDPQLIDRSAAILAKGYERLLGFESPSGGFEWFGGDPGHDALTAYGLLEFTDMSQVRAVDAVMLDRTRAWLLKQRDGQGGYQRKTRTLHTWLAEPEVAFSYNTWALLESGSTADLSREVKWIGETAARTSNSYVIALAANVLALGGDVDGANRLLDKLAGLQAENGSVAGATVSVVGSGGEALTIETTALAMTAWLTNPSYTEQVEKGIRYLAEACKGGRFGSTQSTVLALRGIVAYDQARAKPRAPGSVSLWVDGKPIGKPIPFDVDTHGSVRLPDFASQLEPGKHSVELRMKGGSEMPCLVNINYNTMKPPSSPECQLHLEVKLADSEVREGATTDAEVIVVNRSEKEVPTPTAIIGIPGGLEVRHDQLKEAVKQDLIAAYEVRGREVILYWRVLDAEQRVRVPLSLVGAVPGVYRAPASRAYLYYTDEHKHWVEGVQATILPAE